MVRVVLVLSFQSCLTLCNPMDSSLPHSLVHGILQARTVEWVAMPSSRGSSRPRDRTQVSCITGGCYTAEPLGTSVARVSRYIFLRGHINSYSVKHARSTTCYSLWCPMKALCVGIINTVSKHRFVPFGTQLSPHPSCVLKVTVLTLSPNPL